MTDDETQVIAPRAADPPEDPNAPAPVIPISEYDPRKDPGPERHEDEGQPESIWGDEVVDLETQRKDDTTLLATDRVSVDAENNFVIVPLEQE